MDSSTFWFTISCHKSFFFELTCPQTTWYEDSFETLSLRGLWIPLVMYLLQAQLAGEPVNVVVQVVWVFTYPRVHSSMSSVTRGVYQALDCIRGWTTTLFSRNSYKSLWQSQPTKQVFHELGHAVPLFSLAPGSSIMDMSCTAAISKARRYTPWAHGQESRIHGPIV